MGATLLAHVKKHPGQRGEQIAKALRTDVGTMRLPMKALIKAKKIRTKGQRRGMQYFTA
jgi:predicted transcriptional regulator